MENLINIIYPKRCFICDKILHLKSQETLCDICKKKVRWITGNICSKCGKPLEEHRLKFCFDCSKREQEYNQGRGMYLYKEEVIHSIHRYKYGNRKGYGKSFAKELTRFYLENINWEIDLITSVPLHPKKLKERGFNQSSLIADILSRNLNIEVNNFLLIRTKNTRPQKDLSDLERILNVRDVFSINKKYTFIHKNILIIDDIYTTGNTINNCAKILKDNGAGNVYFLTVAIGKGQ